MIEQLLRRDRLVIMIGLLLVSLAAWGWMFAGAGMGMNGLEMTRHSLMAMNAPATSEWTLSYAVLIFFMWWVMMIAMMIPGASPVILMAAAINRRCSPDTQPYGSTAAFSLGYLLAWLVFSLLAVLAQWLLSGTAMINSLMQSRSDLFSAALLIAAGAWQLTPWKQACLKHCRGPVEFLTRNRRKGNMGALIMGAQHGLYCLGCCWFMMALLFVGGVMNLLWIAGLAIYVWVEKVMPGGQAVARVMGILLVIWAAGLLL